MKTMNTFKLMAVTACLAALFGCDGCTPQCDPNIPFPEPGFCPDPSLPRGSEGGRCATWTQNCDGEGELTCIAGACAPCGRHGEVCCSDFNRGCSPGICDRNPDDYDTCSETCGRLNQPCCATNECGEGTCTQGVCTNSVPACEQGPEYHIGQRNILTHCAARTPIIVHGADEATALECARNKLFPGHELVGTLKSPNEFQLSTPFLFCPGEKFGGWERSTKEEWVYSENDKQQCMESYCLVDCSEPYFGECEPQQ